MTGEMYDVAIVGAGPAGSTAAHRLAQGKARVVVFDPSHPREKVCGGGISAATRRMFFELEEVVGLGKTGRLLRLVSPSGRVATVEGGEQTFAIDRAILDSFLLERATGAGARHVAAQVVRVRREDAGFALHTTLGEYQARVLIGADGVFSIVRRYLVGAHRDEHLACGYHALVPHLDPVSALIHFFGDVRGYGWVFNRRDQSSVGIGIPRIHRDGWRTRFEEYFALQAPGRDIPPVRGWCLPQATAEDVFDIPCAGDDWCLVGDAAGHVDPLTGEGIRYAMWSGALAARAILVGKPRRYDDDWREAYEGRFRKRIATARILEDAPKIERLIRMSQWPFIGARLFKSITGAA